MPDIRYPPLVPSQISEESKPYNQRLEDIISANFGPNGELFTYRNSDGALIGPFPIFRESGSAGSGLYESYAHYAKCFSDFPLDAREVTILTVAAKFQSGFVIYSHKEAAVKRAGLTREQVDQLAAGSKPPGLSEKSNISYDTAHHLINVPGPLPHDLYDKCVRILGKNATLGLLHYVGNYSYVSVLLNGADAGVPDDA